MNLGAFSFAFVIISKRGILNSLACNFLIAGESLNDDFLSAIRQKCQINANKNIRIKLICELKQFERRPIKSTLWKGLQTEH